MHLVCFGTGAVSTAARLPCPRDGVNRSGTSTACMLKLTERSSVALIPKPPAVRTLRNLVAPLAISDPVRIDRDDIHLVKHRWLNTIPGDICACLLANFDAAPILADRELAPRRHAVLRRAPEALLAPLLPRRRLRRRRGGRDSSTKKVLSNYI